MVVNRVDRDSAERSTSVVRLIDNYIIRPYQDGHPDLPAHKRAVMIVR
jgi:hypothetical protein